MHLAFITAGGAGMFCGSCMHDNMLSRALMQSGCEVSLLPTYTPLRLDEHDQSTQRVFLGGVNVYLDALFPWWRALPRWSKRWLDAPALLRLVSRFAVRSDARKLGQLTVAMLQGEYGPEHDEFAELAEFLGTKLRPDAVLFSNALLAGTLPALRRRFSGPVACLLQGDDIFLQNLPEPFQSQALDLLRPLARQFDVLLVHSAYYRDFMSQLLDVDPARFRLVPLGIDLALHTGQPRERPGSPFTVGYFARICPEKGLHRLVEGFRRFHQRCPNSQLVAGGYLGARDREYFHRLKREARDLGAAFHYAGSPDTASQKVALLQSFDLFSVPTEYHEPKGISVLEALANGVPVVQPQHGAFPELLAATQGGLLVPPNDPEALAVAFEQLYADPDLRRKLAVTGRQRVHERCQPGFLAEQTLAALADFLTDRSPLTPASDAGRTHVDPVH